MVWLVIIFFMTTILAVGRVISYKRQLKHICRQITFHHQHESNIMVTHNIYSKEAKELIAILNEWIDHKRRLTQAYHQKEEQIKETISGLSHDIRTPLTSLDGYYQLLAESDDQEQRQRYLTIMSDRIESLKNLIEELFAYTQVHDQSLNLTNIDLNQFTFDTVFSFFEDFSKKGVVPELALKEHPVFITGDVNGLKRVLHNIIKNALEHGQQDFKVTIHTDNDTVQLHFSNQAYNLDQIDIAKVFERFYKGDFARQNSSTGLGLAIAKELVEQMNGDLIAKVDENIFTITLSFQLAREQMELLQLPD